MVFIVWAQTSMLDSAWGGPSRPATPPVPLRSGAASLARRTTHSPFAMCCFHCEANVNVRALSSACKLIAVSSAADARERQTVMKASRLFSAMRRSDKLKKPFCCERCARGLRRNRRSRAGVYSPSAHQHAGQRSGRPHPSGDTARAATA